MTMRQLIDYFNRTNADLDAPLFLQAGGYQMELENIIEDSRGIYLISEE